MNLIAQLAAARVTWTNSQTPVKGVRILQSEPSPTRFRRCWRWFPREAPVTVTNNALALAFSIFIVLLIVASSKRRMANLNDSMMVPAELPDFHKPH